MVSLIPRPVLVSVAQRTWTAWCLFSCVMSKVERW